MVAVEEKLKGDLIFAGNSISSRFENPNSKKRMYDEELSEIIVPFVNGDSSPFIFKNVPSAIRSNSKYFELAFIHAALRNGQFDRSQLGLSALYKYWHNRTVLALMTSDDPGGRAGYIISTEEFVDVLLFLAIDWPDHARETVETLLDYWDAGFRSGQIPFEIVPDYPGWFAIKLARQWLGDAVDERYEFEPADADLKALNGVLQTWNNPDVTVFQTALDEAATFHVLESGENRDSWSGDDRFAIPDDFHWFFPVELLAACRLRQYKGLEMPNFSHPLFQATVMGPLPTPIPVPEDDLLNQLLPLFAKVTGKLTL
jgi:hypothetical protein